MNIRDDAREQLQAAFACADYRLPRNEMSEEARAMVPDFAGLLAVRALVLRMMARVAAKKKAVEELPGKHVVGWSLPFSQIATYPMGDERKVMDWGLSLR